jgi:hypothetical protein
MIGHRFAKSHGRIGVATFRFGQHIRCRRGTSTQQKKKNESYTHPFILAV